MGFFLFWQTKGRFFPWHPHDCSPSFSHLTGTLQQEQLRDLVGTRQLGRTCDKSVGSWVLGHVYAANGQKAKAVCKIKCNREAEAVSGTCKVPWNEIQLSLRCGMATPICIGPTSSSLFDRQSSLRAPWQVMGVLLNLDTDSPNVGDPSRHNANGMALLWVILGHFSWAHGLLHASLQIHFLQCLVERLLCLLLAAATRRTPLACSGMVSESGSQAEKVCVPQTHYESFQVLYWFSVSVISRLHL